MYKPLPSNLTIKNSEIEGLGLFAIEDIPQGTNLGVSHRRGHKGWNRTPLGGFYNHSDEPNCIKKEKHTMFDKTLSLCTARDIKAGEEITVAYTLYKIRKEV